MAMYEYMCSEGHITTKEMSISEYCALPEEERSKCKCDVCKKVAHRFMGEMASVIIPDHFKAVGGSNDDGPTSLDNLQRRFAHSHPSGREGKIYY